MTKPAYQQFQWMAAVVSAAERDNADSNESLLELFEESGINSAVAEEFLDHRPELFQLSNMGQA